MPTPPPTLPPLEQEATPPKPEDPRLRPDADCGLPLHCRARRRCERRCDSRHPSSRCGRRPATCRFTSSEIPCFKTETGRFHAPPAAMPADRRAESPGRNATLVARFFLWHQREQIGRKNDAAIAVARCLVEVDNAAIGRQRGIDGKEHRADESSVAIAIVNA
jgi:hypothetical protein